MVKCPRCGYENNRNSTYCVNCTYMLKDPNNKSKKKITSSSSGSNKKTIKRIAILLVIIVAALLIFSLINMIAPEPNNSLSIVTTNETGIQTSSTPYVVVIDYNGSWVASMGDIKNIVDYAGQGKFEKRLNCVVWDHVYVDAKKDDGGNGTLSVRVYNNGKLIFEDSTQDTSKSIHFELND